MKKILAFAGSNSSKSVNHRFVSFIAEQLTQYTTEVIRLTDYPLPIFSIDAEENEGYPEELKALQAKIAESNALVISVNEHNGTVSAYFKNVMDWLSRIEHKWLEGKKVLLISVSPGKRGGLSALEYTHGILPRYNAEVIAALPFPSFFENFSEEKNTIVEPELAAHFKAAIQQFEEAL